METLLSGFQALLPWLPGGLWCAWWLFAVNWKKLHPLLLAGGWIPVLLLTWTVALAWSRINPTPCSLFGLTLPAFWWQLGACLALTLVALLCGWLQGKIGCTPAEVPIESIGHPHPVHHDSDTLVLSAHSHAHHSK